ncbi:hypothetical protein [Haloplanus salilacus]|uniref:hypothetical protein n=1 Tax=Haloplanus salilacus TaxID=2949994 RepID=UPI0030D46A51
MGSVSPLNEDDLRLLVAYSPSSDEEMCEAVVNSFLAAGIDVSEKPTQLVDWINADVFDDLQWSANRPLRLGARIWGHRVVITSEEIRIYTLS